MQFELCEHIHAEAAMVSDFIALQSPALQALPGCIHQCKGIMKYK